VPSYVAFLRAINLGRVRQFPQDDIRSVVESLGCTDVETHINTGNVRLTTPMRSRAKVEAALEAAFAADRGFEVPTIVLTPAELSTIAEQAASFDHPGKHYVELLRDEPSPELAASLEAGNAPGRMALVRGRTVHFLVDTDYASAALMRKAVERQLGTTTNRNASVLIALAAKWGAGASGASTK